MAEYGERNAQQNNEPKEVAEVTPDPLLSARGSERLVPDILKPHLDHTLEELGGVKGTWRSTVATFREYFEKTEVDPSTGFRTLIEDYLAGNSSVNNIQQSMQETGVQITSPTLARSFRVLNVPLRSRSEALRKYHAQKHPKSAQPVKTKTFKEINPSSSKGQILRLLQQHRQDHGNRPVELAEIAPQISSHREGGQGITRERTRQIYNILEKQYQLPDISARVSGIKFSPEEIELLDKEVRYMRRHLEAQEIADSIGMTLTMVTQSVGRVDIIVRKEIDEVIKTLRAKHLTNEEIGKAIGRPIWYVRHRVTVLIEQFEIPRFRNRKTYSEISIFDEEIKRLRDVEKLGYRQIVQRLSESKKRTVTLGEVEVSVRRLLQSGGSGYKERRGRPTKIRLENLTDK